MVLPFFLCLFIVLKCPKFFPKNFDKIGKLFDNIFLYKYRKAQVLTSDLLEMIQDATPEEKQLLQRKIATLATKIV